MKIGFRDETTSDWRMTRMPTRIVCVMNYQHCSTCHTSQETMVLLREKFDVYFS